MINKPKCPRALTSMLTATVLAAASWASPSPVAAQPPAYVPAASMAYEPEPPPLDAPRPTRSNRIHIVGLVLGGAGVVGGAVLMFVGALASAFCGFGSSSSSGSCGGGGMFIAGAVILPVGALAMIGSGIALGVDRVPVEPRLSASLSSEGAGLSLDMAF